MDDDVCGAVLFDVDQALGVLIAFFTALLRMDFSDTVAVSVKAICTPHYLPGRYPHDWGYGSGGIGTCTANCTPKIRGYRWIKQYNFGHLTRKYAIFLRDFQTSTHNGGHSLGAPGRTRTDTPLGTGF